LRQRDKAIAVVLLNSAMRATELLSMKVADFSTDGRITIVGKGGKRRTVALGRSGVEAVESYLQVRESTAKSLWLSHDGNPMTKSALKQSMARVRREAPSIDDGVFAHRFRHTAITRLLRGGVPLRAVQLYAGHSNPQTTLGYAQAIDADDAITAVDSNSLNIRVTIIFNLFNYVRHYYRPSHLNSGNRLAIQNYVERISSGEVKLLEVACPNCRACKFDLLFRSDRYGIPWKTVVCRECGMLYSNPQMTEDSTKEFYTSDDYRRIYGGGDLLRDSADMFDMEGVDKSDDYHRLTHFDFIMESMEKVETVAEIGAGGGWNLIPFINENIVCQGYEFSPRLIEAGQQQGIDMVDLSDSQLSGRFDIIMLRHVLEHVDDPITQLKQLSSHLTENGQLFIEVPGIVDKIPSLQNAHYHYFSEITLNSILGQAGFEITNQLTIRRNGYLLVLAKYSGIPLHSVKLRGEYQRVLEVVSKGRKGMLKATLVEKLPSPVKKSLMKALGR
jgi:SAM-dependent methyltransferase